MTAGEAPPLSPQAHIEAKARGVIEIALRADEVNFRVGAGVKRLAAEAAAEYHDRFLIELVQNAHDAHPADSRDGRIEIVMAWDEAEFGVLYIANAGRPFSASNFDTICELGLSDKLPSESIGNKGIGFKSVLQICARPEIYSAIDGEHSEFRGYCFSFATDEDLLDLLEGNEQQLEVIRRETAPFHLPVALASQVEVARELGGRGMSTVVRLPLDRERAREDVAKQLDTLRSGATPLLLFLDRLSAMVIEERRDDGTKRTELTRRPESIAVKGHDVAMSIVDLAGEGRYLSSSTVIPSDEMREVIAQAHEDRELDDRWLDWEASADVTVAVRLDQSEEEGRFYTFLPMEVASPFAGHLNAPFYAKLDRRDLNRSLALNSALLDAAARACATAAMALAARDEEEFVNAAVDLVAWDRTESARLITAFEALGARLESAPLFPIVGRKDLKRGTLAETYVWSGEGFRFLTPETIAAAVNVDILDGSMGSSRVERVEELHQIVLGRGMEPEPSELAEWAEAVAMGPLSEKRKIGPWRRFYDELERAFGDDGEELVGKRILLDEDWNVQPAGLAEDLDHPTDPTVFFQPRERAEDFVDVDAAGDIRIPKTLRRWIVFVHGDLNWLERVGKTQQRTDARRFLEENDLIQRYQARTLLERLKGIATTTKSQKVFSDALRLAYRLQRTRAEDERPALRELGLRVPTRDGWKPAGQAYFGAAWPQTLGGSLERLIGLAAGASTELEQLESWVMPSPEDWPFPIDSAQWTLFLRKLGVTDGLAPVATSSRARARPYEFTPDRIGRQAGVPAGIREEWSWAVESAGGKPSQGNGSYANRSAFYWLPGQADYAAMSEKARLEYAALVIASLGHWSESHFATEIRRTDVTSRNFDQFVWPTPLAAFVNDASWVPQPSPDARDELTWSTPAESWHYAERYTDEAMDYARPDYARLIPPNLRRSLDRRPNALLRLREAGLNVWNDPADAVKLADHLAALVAADSVAESYVANLRKTYEQAWENIVDHRLETNPADMTLIVSRGGRLEMIRWLHDHPREPIYVRDGGSRLADSVLQLSSRPILDVGARVGRKIADDLSEAFGESVLRTSGLEVMVLADGSTVTPDPANLRLIDGDLIWLERLVVAVLELKRSAFRRVTQVVRDRAIGTLRSARVVFATHLELKIGEEALPSPHAMRDALPLHHDDYPTIVVRAPGPSLTWQELNAAVPALCDLIAHPELTDSLRLAVSRLASGDPGASISAPGLGALATALDEPEEEVASAVQGLRGSIEMVVERLAPAVFALAGAEEADRFLEAAHDVDTEADLAAALAGLELAFPPDELIRLAAALSLDEFRCELKISLGRFNESLQALGQPPIHYTEEHRGAFAAFVASSKEPILARLRHAHYLQYRDKQPLTQYVASRDGLTGLAPDPTWLDEYEVPSDELMQSVVDEWLEGETEGLTQSSVRLRSVEIVQRENRAHLRSVLERAQPLVTAWSQKRGEQVPAGWNDSELERRLWDRLLEGGRADFEPLTDDDVVAWLIEQQLWGVEMSATLDVAIVGLTEQDLSQAQSEEALKRARDEFAKRSIEIDGTRHSADLNSYAALAAVAMASITDQFLKTRSGFTEMTEMPVVRHSPGGNGIKVKAANRPMNDTQRGATGLVGEVLALAWLKGKYGSATDDAWKSGNRDYVLGGKRGDDSLGYDFEVPSGRTTFFFEVKASVGAEMEIEVAESELRAARLYSRGLRYRILYIPNVLDPDVRAIYVLPNPFSDRAREFYRPTGAGLKYKFLLEGR
jgi:hypothetical protein